MVFMKKTKARVECESILFKLLGKPTRLNQNYYKYWDGNDVYKLLPPWMEPDLAIPKQFGLGLKGKITIGGSWPTDQKEN